MDQVQLEDLGTRLKARHRGNRLDRERAERRAGFGLLGIGLLGAAVAVAVLVYAFGG